MKLLKILFPIVLVGITLASAVPHVFPDFWLTDIFSHFKLQYVIVLMFFLLPIALYPPRKKIFPIALILILVGYNSWFIVPLYSQNKNIIESSGESLSILSMNLLASNTNYHKAIDLIREKDPDILVILELSPQWELQLQELYPRFPFRHMFPQNNNFGIGIMSKIPMFSELTELGNGFPPSILSEIKIKDRPVNVLATHPVPPVTQERFKLRNNQLEEIARLSARENDQFILVGDLNTSSYSRHFQDLLENGILKDTRKGFGIASTWPSDLLIMRTTLDHILYKGEMRVLNRTIERSIGSDHLPVYLEIGL